MTESFNKLTPAEAERLALLSEECAEVIMAIGKFSVTGLRAGTLTGGQRIVRLWSGNVGT